MTEPRPLSDSSERVWVMTRCPTSGSVYTCGCEPRWSSTYDEPDYSCSGEGDKECEITYIAVDALLSDEAVEVLRSRMFMANHPDVRPEQTERARAVLAAVVVALTGTEGPC